MGAAGRLIRALTRWMLAVVNDYGWGAKHLNEGSTGELCSAGMTLVALLYER